MQSCRKKMVVVMHQTTFSDELLFPPPEFADAEVAESTGFLELRR